METTKNKKKCKIVFFLLDGIGDNFHPDFGNQTCLQVSDIPVMDKLAKSGICGLHDPV